MWAVLTGAPGIQQMCLSITDKNKENSSPNFKKWASIIIQPSLVKCNSIVRKRTIVTNNDLLYFQELSHLVFLQLCHFLYPPLLSLQLLQAKIPEYWEYSQELIKDASKHVSSYSDGKHANPNQLKSWAECETSCLQSNSYGDIM